MFDIEKLVQIVGYLLKKNNGQMNYTKLIKLIYLADKESYDAINHSMTGDTYYALPQGPILSELLNLIKGKSDEKNQSYWDARFTTDGYNLIALSSNIPSGLLSKFEKRTLDNIDREFHNKTFGDMIDFVHDSRNCPEWSDPGPHSRKVITESDILRALGRTKEEIGIIENENTAYEHEEKILSAIEE